MCKLAMISGITKDTRENAWKFVVEMSKQMSSEMDKDGFGYAAMSEDGQLFGERWLYNSQAFKLRNEMDEKTRNILSNYKGFIERPCVYNKFGSLQIDKMTSITLHARYATSGREFENTHPFVHGNTSLIHNGVIGNLKAFGPLLSTCDSEVILNGYMKLNVTNKPHNWQNVASNLDGYYACGVFSKTKQGEVILDIIKDNRANLFSAFVKELNTVVFATKYEHIREACTILGFTITNSFLVKDNAMLRLNAITGKTIGCWEFDSTYKKKGKKAKGFKYSDLSNFNNLEDSDRYKTQEEMDKEDDQFTAEEINKLVQKQLEDRY